MRRLESARLAVKALPQTVPTRTPTIPCTKSYGLRAVGGLANPMCPVMLGSASRQTKPEEIKNASDSIDGGKSMP